MRESERGFTLIEFIATLIVVAILGAIAGMGLTTATKGYLFAKENAHLSQKAQVAMTRLRIELMDLMDIGKADNSSIIFETPSGWIGMAVVGTDLKLRNGKSLPTIEKGDVLIDNVSKFELKYYKGDQEWKPGVDDIKELSTVQVNMSIDRKESGIGVVDFSAIFHIRNNGNYGGAPPGSQPPTQSQYCFLVSTVFGRDNHPVVEVFKELRDKYLLRYGWGRDFIKKYYVLGPIWSVELKKRAYLIPIFKVVFVLLASFILIFLKAPYLLISPLLYLLWRSRRLNLIMHGRGGVLIPLIIVMVIFSALSAAMLTLTTTSTFSPTGTELSSKAYLLAESGFRYAASQYLNAEGVSEREKVLEDLHNQTYTLRDNQGSFTLKIFSYWYKTVKIPFKNQLPSKALGGIPPDIKFGKGYLYIDGKIYGYSLTKIKDPYVTFVKDKGNWPKFSVDTSIYPACKSSFKFQKVYKGGDILLSPNTGQSIFPSKNGQISISQHIYNYKYLDLKTNRLVYITDPNDPDMKPFNLPPYTDIVLEKSLQVHSIGIFGEGSTQMRRKIIYYTPVGWVERGASSQTLETRDTFEDLSKWNPSTLGSHSIAKVGGNKAMKVTSASILWHKKGGKKYYEYQSLKSFKWKATDINLYNIWNDSGKFLSYDLQCKIMAKLLYKGFKKPPVIIKPPIPPKSGPYYMAGISFRLNEKGDSYGISFLKANNQQLIWKNSIIDMDGIPNELVPPVYESSKSLITKPMIVLWMQSNKFEKKRWLAYKVLSYKDYVVDKSGYLKDWSSIHVRVREGASIIFKKGGKVPINDGDTVKGSISKATGKVFGRPLLQGGAWSMGNAKGIILINNLSGSFIKGEWLLVNGEKRAKVDGFRKKDNYIRVYFGDTSAHGKPNDNPFDNNRLSNPRDQFHWSPDEVDQWSKDNDYLTEVRWNKKVDSSVKLISTVDEKNAIIRTDVFLSPSSGSFSRPEIGLHTFGTNSPYIYFDDFALRLKTSGGDLGFLPPIQQ